MTQPMQDPRDAVRAAVYKPNVTNIMRFAESGVHKNHVIATTLHVEWRHVADMVEKGCLANRGGIVQFRQAHETLSAAKSLYILQFRLPPISTGKT